MIDTIILICEFLSAALFPLGQLGRVSFFNQQASIYPYELFMAFACLFLFIRYRFHAITGSPFRKVVLLLLLSLLTSFVLSAKSYSFYDNCIGLLYLLRLVFYIFHFMYLGFHAVGNGKFKQMLLYELVGIVVIIILTSWLQYLFFPNLRPLLYQGWDPHLYRIFSFFFEPYLAGGALGLCLLFLFFRWQASDKMKYFKLGVLVMLFVLIMLTFSRTVYLATLITVMLLLVQRRKPALIFGLLLLFVTLAIIIPKPEGVGVQLFRTFSIETRLADAGEGINLWLKQPIFGVGYNRIRYKKAELGLALEYGSSHAAANYHSSFITMLAAGGIFGLIFYSMFLGSLMRVSRPAFYYILFLSVISFGDNALLHPFMMFLFFRLIIIELNQSSLA